MCVCVCLSVCLSSVCPLSVCWSVGLSVCLQLEPPCADIGLLDYHRKEEIEERAYQYALPLLRAFVQQVSDIEVCTAVRCVNFGDCHVLP